MEAVEQANNAYWDSKKIDTSSEYLIRYKEIEKAYFDIITPKVNINDKDAAQQFLMAQRERMAVYIQARYGSYLEELLEKYGYGQQDNNRGPKR